MRISDWSSDVCSSDLGYDPTTAAKIDARVQADADFSSRFKDLAKAVFAAVEEAAKSIKQPPPFAVIKDAGNKQVGRLFQDGGLEVSDNSYAGLKIGRAHV